MLSGPLPDSVNFVEYLENGASLRGFVPISRFVRFSKLLANEEGDLDLTLHFEESEAGLATVVGAAAASVGLLCQNCLEVMTLQLVVEVNVRLVKNDSELYALSAKIDGIVADTPRLSLIELLEDDLILCLPMAPRHEAPCSEILKEANTETRRPFADLSKLLSKRETD